MLALIGSVMLDRRDQGEIVRITRAHRLEDAVYGRIPAMLVIDIDRSKHVEVAAGDPGEHAISQLAVCGHLVIFRVPLGEEPLRLQSDTGFSLGLAMGYSTGCHTTFHHRYHLVWAPKYRFKVLHGESGSGCARSSAKFAPRWA